MTKRKIIIGVLVAAALFSMVEATLRNKKINDLPDTAAPVEFSTFYLARYPSEKFEAIKYNGREYAYYGYESRPLLSWEIGECFAYHEDSRRFYTLTGTDDYIADIYMDYAVHEAVFYRALDTIGKDIKTPGYITSGMEYRADIEEGIVIWE